MKLNSKGYSIVEMFAVIFISSLIIFPLITTLVNNMEINDREQKRRAASSIAQSTLENLNRLTFTDIETLVGNANGSGDYYIELNSDNCVILAASSDQALCTQIFATIWNNVTFDSTQFRVFIINYNLPTSYINSLSINNNLPVEVRTIISNYPTSTAPNPSLLRVIVWIAFDDDTGRTLDLDGLISNE